MRQVWKLPQTQENTAERPERCLPCRSQRNDRHSRLQRRVIDPELATVGGDALPL